MQTQNIKRLSRYGFWVVLVGFLISLLVLAWLLQGHQTLREEGRVVNDAYRAMLEFKDATEKLLTSNRLQVERHNWEQLRNRFEEHLDSLERRHSGQLRLNEVIRLWHVAAPDAINVSRQLDHALLQDVEMQDKSILRRLGENFQRNSATAQFATLNTIANSLNYLTQYQDFMVEEFRQLVTEHTAQEHERFARIRLLTLLLPSLIWLLTILFSLLFGHLISRIEGELLDTQGSLRESLDTLESQRNELDYMAHHDSLTALPNRLQLLDRLDSAINRARRNGNIVALLFIDLDRFKQINDSFGHSAGDELLKLVADRLRGSLREQDTIARLGGDEFVVMLEDVASPGVVGHVANTILDLLQAPLHLEGRELFITISIGISLFPQDCDEPERLLRNADSAMYRAKEEGRNTFNFYTSELTEQAYQRLALETQLRRAIGRNELEVFYQPQLNARSGEIIGMEALVRWNHPHRGLLAPGHFIALAEESGLIVPIGEWVLAEASRQFADWYERGLSPGTLAVNLAGNQLKLADLFERISATLEASHCNPQWLELEVTETFVMTRPEAAIGVLQKLRGYGVRIAIDDFGTGYSSLAYLKRLPISKLKIDQSFVRELPLDSENNAIVRTIIALTHTLGLDVIAEGVETREQCKFLMQQGCENVQGYLYGKPMPAREMEQMLIRRDTLPC